MAASQAPGETQTEPTNHNFKPGSIRSIKLINFMCHDSFELQFGPRVNFVIGPNGSGKSALLTAIVVALGGRATTTCRAKKNSDFVMYGKNQAKVIVVVHNYTKIMEKEQAFKPDDYGKFITIEKTLYKDDVSKLTIRNDRDKKISERAQELHEILDHFGILINNPICILNQEVSKTFLHSKRPEDKFELFMKATNLEQIEQDYLEAETSHKEWGANNNRKSFAFKLLDTEYERCKEQTCFLENLAKLSDTRSSLNLELVWSIVEENEAVCKELQKNVDDFEVEINNAKVQFEKRKKKIKSGQEDIEVAQARTKAIADQLQDAKGKLSTIRDKERDIKTKHFEAEQRVEQAKRMMARHQSEKSRLEKNFNELKKQFPDQNSLEQDNGMRKVEIEKLESQIESSRNKVKSLRLHTDQLSNSMIAIRKDLHSANMNANSLKSKLSAAQSNLRRLKNGQDNTIRKFGDFVIKIRDEIERESRFKRKPIGPLGYYIKLKTPDVAPALETHLGRNAHAFACDNHEDMILLKSIFRKMGNLEGFRQPLMIVRPFNRKHNTARFKADHEDHKTLLDCINIDEPAVFNALVDRCFLESVLFIPEYSEAEAIMINPSLVPKNTRMAYTRDCSAMHPRTEHQSYKSFANNPKTKVLFSESNTAQIERMEREIELISAESREADVIAQRSQDNLAAQRREYDSNSAEIHRVLQQISKLEERLLDLKTRVTTQQPQELSKLEGDIEAIITIIGKENINLGRYLEILASCKKELDEIQKEKNVCLDLMKKYEEERDLSKKTIEDTKKTIDEFDREMREWSVIIESRKKQKLEEIGKLEEAIQNRARSEQALQGGSSKPDRVRQADVIRNEIRTIENQFRTFQEELRDPEETMQNLRKRMTEIKNLTSLKDSNLSNYSLTSKTLDQRREGFQQLRTLTINSVTTTFSTVMRTMRMNGELRIYLDNVMERGEIIKKAKTLEMRIDTNYNPSQRVGSVMGDSHNITSQLNDRRVSRSQPVDAESSGARSKRPRLSRTAAVAAAAAVATTAAAENNGAGDQLNTSGKENEIRMTDARSLSGGERSFSTVAFVLALWHHCASPFKLMDEIDVFMDMVTRRVSYNALIRFAQCSEDPGQFVFFSPLELPRIDNSDSFVKVFEMPPITRKRPHGSVDQ